MKTNITMGLGNKLKRYLRKNHNIYNKEYIWKLLNQIKNGGSNYKLNFVLSQKLWGVLMFGVWCWEYILNEN